MTSTSERDALLMTFILDAAQDLGPEYAEVMRLSFAESLSVVAVAKRLGRSPGGVQSLKNMALDRARWVRELFERLERSEDPDLAAFIGLARYSSAAFIQYASEHAARLASCYSHDDMVLLLAHSDVRVREAAIVLAPRLRALRP